MKMTMFRLMNFLMLSIILPFASGCNGGGGGGSSLVGSLFSASSDGSTLGGGPGSVGGLGGIDGGGGVTGASLASIHNPEPTTMLLVGGGMMAMAYFRNRNNS